jgi:hypothetical protein
MGLMFLQKETPRAPCPVYYVKTQEGGPSPETKPVSTLISDFPASRTVTIKLPSNQAMVFCDGSLICEDGTLGQIGVIRELMESSRESCREQVRVCHKATLRKKLP